MVMKWTKFKQFDAASFFANKIGQMFFLFREERVYTFELKDRKKAKQYGLSRYQAVSIYDNNTRDKDSFHYEITLYDTHYNQTPMMKIPDAVWIGLYNYFVELYTRWGDARYWKET